MQYILVLFVNFFAFCVSYIIKRPKKRIIFDIFVIGFTMFFVCFGYMTGTDWRNYETSYQWLGFNNFLSSLVFWEPGFLFCVSLFKLLNIDFWHFLISIKIFTFIVFCRFLYKYAGSKFFLVLTLFLSFYGYYFWIDNPLRNLCAFTVFLFAINAILYRKRNIYILLIMLAVSFHYSSIILLPIYWIVNFKINNWGIVICYLLVSILFFNVNIVFKLIDFLFGWFPVLKEKLDLYSSSSDGKVFSFGYIMHNIFFILILLSRKKIESFQCGHIIFMGAVIYIFLFRLGLTFTVFMRFAMYFAVLYSLAAVYVLDNIRRSSKPIYMLYIFLVSCLVCYKSITTDSRYIPYSNYLEYLCKPKPSFEYRSSYNEINSPYKTNKL